MNKIFNPNNIFAFPLKAYDLQNVFFCKELLKERFWRTLRRLMSWLIFLN